MDSVNYDSEFAVGVPVYNESPYIERTLLSIIETVGEDVPIYVSDNHSTDDTVKIVECLRERYPSIRLVKNLDDRVASNFMNCIMHARSRYFCWISGHDQMCGNFWKRAIGMLREDPDLVWVYGSCELIDADGMPYESINPPDSDVDNYGVTDVEIIKKLIRVCSGMFIHGVFRTEVMIGCPYAGGWASDRCAIAYACFRGGVKWIRETSIIRRVHRFSSDEMETEEQRNERYRSWGCLEYEDAGFDPDIYIRMKLLRIYLGERIGKVKIQEIREIIKTLFKKGTLWRDISILWSLRKLRPVESSLPPNCDFLN
jgi:glycosyltransferase involved in cell wall biosynthesis